MSPKPLLNVIVASTRPGRVGAQVGDWFVRAAREHAGFELRVVDLAELNLPFLDETEAAVNGLPYEHEHTRQWSAITASADAFVIVFPEYNQGYTAPLKNALDYLFTEWHDKPVGLVSYGMTSGGLRAAQSLKPVLSALKMMPLLESVVVHLRETLDAEGELQPTCRMDQQAKGMLDELQRVAGAFATLRTAMP